MDKRKILFFDIDETLLSHKTFTIKESTKNALKKAESYSSTMHMSKKGNIQTTNIRIW